MSRRPVNFADRVAEAVEATGSILCAGIDPVLETIPQRFRATGKGTSREAIELRVAHTLSNFCEAVVDCLRPLVAAIKPNIAFFEQYGIGGLRAYDLLCRYARDREVLVVSDAKRGDIGSTATAYSNAFIGEVRIDDQPFTAFPSDAVTVNPFLGFDTLLPFVAACQKSGSGIFVLTRTSNPGAGAIQQALVSGERQRTPITVSESVAQWIAEQGRAVLGTCGFSSIGAVVGATYPDEARKLRHLMPDAIFLIPGYGAQGASADDAKAGLSQRGCGGGLVVSARALFADALSSSDFSSELARAAVRLSAPLPPKGR